MVEQIINNYRYSSLTESDAETVISIFNYYIKNSDAAFFEEPVTLSFYENFKQLMQFYPTVSVKESDGSLIGFGMLRPHNIIPVFRKTSVISYFVDPKYTGKGIGHKMLDYLERAALKKGITIILAEISSFNELSIRFHEKNGFSHCGRFRCVGIKNGKEFDTIWMQKELLEEE